LPEQRTDQVVTTEYFDIVIVGAGLSGVGAACHLQEKCPGKSYVILEGREAMGGTWDLFRYPGIRSDSDMHTLGYNFKPWLDSRAIADGPAILEYVQETAAEHDVERHIRYRHRVVLASWSSARAAWAVKVYCEDTGEVREFACNMLLLCAGYYRYEQGYLPEFEGRESFSGDIVHPQHWPEDLDYHGKKVVVIGSGATAVTLIPAMAEDAGHIVMLQRSPTYVFSQPDTDSIANALRKILPEKFAYAITRWKNISIQQFMYRQTRKRPGLMKRFLLRRVRKELGEDYDVEKHFTPAYNPWDQRVCLVPNSDLFAAIRSGKASVVTDKIDRFTHSGILLKSGEELEAEIIVTATGLDLLVLGGIAFEVDGNPVDFSETFTYKGIMSSDVPNLVSTFGYINASWTLRADLIAEFFCRLVNHMDASGYRQCTPRLRDEERDMPEQPWIVGFSSGYIQRVLDRLPKQGDHEPWNNPQNYARDKKMFQKGAIEDGVLSFSNRAPGKKCA
jgi:cation diffusion facilitator CzcD-associated flavoprotein CzcO